MSLVRLRADYHEHLGLRRPLTHAEQYMAVFEIDNLLNAYKDRLDRIIEQGKGGAIRNWRRGRLSDPTRQRQAQALLAELYREGQRHAEAELRSMGLAVKGKRAPASGKLLLLQHRLEAQLATMMKRVRLELNYAYAVRGLTKPEAAKLALRRARGARAAAAEVVSSAFTSGLDEVFERNADQVGGWQYSAILDANTCPECAAYDGMEFAAYEEIRQVLPGGGPNPSCYGGGRCRCRAVALPPASAPAAPVLRLPTGVPTARSSSLRVAR